MHKFTSDTLGEVVRHERRMRSIFYFDPETGEQRKLDDVADDPYFYSKYPPSEETIVESPYKRFIVFSGDDYYPDGGFRDMVADCDGLQEAVEIVAKLKNAPDWAHALDTQTGILYDLLMLQKIRA